MLWRASGSRSCFCCLHWPVGPWFLPIDLLAARVGDSATAHGPKFKGPLTKPVAHRVKMFSRCNALPRSCHSMGRSAALWSRNRVPQSGTIGMLRSRHTVRSKSITQRPRTGAASFRPTMSTSEHTPAAAARMIAAITTRGLWQLAVMRTQIALPPRKTVEQRHAATPVQTDSFAFRSAGGRSPSPA